MFAITQGVVGQVDVGSHTGSCLHAGVIIRDYGRSVAKGQSGPCGYFQTHLFTIHMALCFASCGLSEVEDYL